MIMDMFLCWNLRDINAPNKQRDVTLFCKENKVHLCGFVETKIKKDNADSINKRIFPGWEYFINHNSHPNGRTWIVWDGNLCSIKILAETDQMVMCFVEIKQLNKAFFMTFVYAFSTKEMRLPLWKDLSKWSDIIVQQPWIIARDFNCVLEFKDRNGGQPVH